MEFSVRTFFLMCIISIGSAKLPAFEESEDSDYSGEIQNGRDEMEKTHWKRQQGYNDRGSDHYHRIRYEGEPGTPGPEVTRLLRTYGRGTALVTRQGQTVDVPNEYRRNGHKSAGNGHERAENEVKPPRRGGACRDCPADQKVIASKGNSFAILPEPCPSNPKMWSHHSGPRPGTQIQGMNTIRGYIGSKKKFCQYQYEVIVRRCEALSPKDDTRVECSADNSWGSTCNVTCGQDKEALGPTQLECKEDLTWSNPLPACKGKTDCTTPRVKAKSRISCQTPDMREARGDFIPNGSTCKFRQNEKDVSINCKDGRWRVVRKSRPPASGRSPGRQEKKDPCSPNPCRNGGTCLRPESSKGPPICRCRPQTRGLHCEMRECYYNICENDGLCFFLNEERVCYCTPEYSGDTCQSYSPQG